MHVQRLIAGLVDSGRFEEALNEFASALQRGVSNKWIYNGAGSAYVGLQRYEEAIRSFSAEPDNPEKIADLQIARIHRGFGILNFIYTGFSCASERANNYFRILVGAGRFERPTPCAQGRCATRLRYAPTSSIVAACRRDPAISDCHAPPRNVRARR
jgi:hypothetical protein